MSESRSYEEISRHLEKVKNIILQFKSCSFGFSLDVKTTRSEFPMQAEIGKREFIEAVKTVKSHIKRGDIFQCVISGKF